MCHTNKKNQNIYIYSIGKFHGKLLNNYWICRSGYFLFYIFSNILGDNGLDP